MKRVFGRCGPSIRRKMYQRAMIVPLVVAVSMGMAACGGGGDEKLSKADLGKKANEICKTAKNAARKIAAPANLVQDPVAAAAYFNKIAPITQKETDDLAKLKPADATAVGATTCAAG